MISRHNVLVFPAGSEIGIEIYNSLKYNLHFNVFGASGKTDHAKFLYESKKYIEDEDLFIQNINFIKKINSIIIENKIRFIFPTHDSIALFLIEKQRKIKAEILTSPFDTALIARDKSKIYKLFSNEIFCPKIFDYNIINSDYPVFIKPKDGQGGKGAFIVNNDLDLNFLLKKDNNLIISEFLPGEELSVDCFTDKNKNLLFVGPRTRDRVQMGISFNSKSVKLTDEILYIAKTINDKLILRGAWFFQIKRDVTGNFKLLEFAVRQASTMGLYRQLGINFALLTLFDRLGYNLNILKNDYSIELDRCLENKFNIDYQFENVYLDFDDTLVINDKVNLEAIKFVYYCVNNQINVFLLTKHIGDINNTLERFGISNLLFKKIIHIDINDDKLSYLSLKKSIFIDNYFFDRHSVLNQLGIPVFDVDAISGLIK